MMKTRNCSLEINSSGLDIDIAGNYNFFTRFLIGISDQTIEYVISRNPEKINRCPQPEKRHSLKIPNNSNLC